MRISLCILLLLIHIFSQAEEKSDSLTSKLAAAATISLNSNGIASIPAFSLGKPAVLAIITLAKGRFSYDPALAYGLNLQPWFIDNWFHYKIIDRQSFTLRTGINVSTFNSNLNLSEDSVFLRAERYLAFEIAGKYKLTGKSNISLAYWSDNGLEDGSISGHFLSVAGERNDMSAGMNLLFSLRLQVFYINYNGNNDGIFTCPTISASLKNIPFSVFLQAIQPLNTNIIPSPGFKWNAGLTFSF